MTEQLSWLRVLSIVPALLCFGVTLLPAIIGASQGEVLMPVSVVVTVLFATYSYARWMTGSKQP
jgi:hypothetical protein